MRLKVQMKRMQRGMASMATKRSSANGPPLLDALYRVFLKRNVTYVTSILVAAVAVEMAYGSATTYVWERLNRGVRDA